MKKSEIPDWQRNDDEEVLTNPWAWSAGPSIAGDLKLKPQAKTILRHLRKHGHISPMQALIVYGIARLAPCVFDIRNIGYGVTTEIKHDAQKHKYARYTL
jgi:hypothetical protein